MNDETKNNDVETVKDAELIGVEGTEISISSMVKPFVVGVIFSPDYAALTAKYHSAQIYSYLYDLDEDVQLEDKLVVKTPDDELVVVTVANIEQTNPMARKYIVDKVDTRKYEERVDRQLKKAQLKAVLEKEIERLDEESKLDAYAAKDSKFAELLKAYREL